MIELLPESDESTIAVIISGKLTHEDYEKLRPEMQMRADRDGDFDVLVELSDVGGLDLEAVRDDLQFTKDFSSDIGRMAVITDDSVWGGLTSFVGAPLGEALGVTVERFDRRDAAWKWLGSD